MTIELKIMAVVYVIGFAWNLLCLFMVKDKDRWNHINYLILYGCLIGMIYGIYLKNEYIELLKQHIDLLKNEQHIS